MYSIILTTHIITACALIAVVLYSDHYGLGWMRGKHEVLSATKLHRLHRTIYVGLGVMIITGLYMFWPVREYLLTETTFLVKMGLVITLIINSIFIGKVGAKATHTSFASLTTKERVPLFIIGAVSSFCWAGTIIAATQLGL